MSGCFVPLARQQRDPDVGVIWHSVYHCCTTFDIKGGLRVNTGTLRMSMCACLSYGWLFEAL